MMGEVYLMEFRTGWRGILLFMLIVVIVTWGMPQLFPSFVQTQEEALEGSSLVNLSYKEDVNEAVLSWEGIPNATGYMVLEDNKTYMLSPRIVYTGLDTEVTFHPDEEEGRYFAVVAMVKGSAEPVLVGLTSLVEEEDPFSQLFENPVYRGFSGGREIQFFTLRGFLSVELFSWWIFLAGLYLAYMSVSTVAGDFEDKRMDIILSTPLSRRRYLIEKFSAQFTITVLAILLAATLTYVSANSLELGEEDQMDFSTVFLAWIGSIPLLFVIQSIAILTVVLSTHNKVGIGLTFLFIFVEFSLYLVAQFGLEDLKYLTVIQYWDYSSVLFDGVFKGGDFLLLSLVVVALIVASIWSFSKKDIPV